MTTEQRIAEIREREQKATKGPWRSFQYRDTEMVHVTECPVSTHDNDASSLADCFNYSFEQDTNNALFIAHSRSDIPWLLEQLDAKVKKLTHISRKEHVLNAIDQAITAACAERDKTIAELSEYKDKLHEVIVELKRDKERLDWGGENTLKCLKLKEPLRQAIDRNGR